MNHFIESVPGWVTSKRFWAAVGGVITVILVDSGLEENQVNEVIAKVLSVAGIIGTWIIGDSMRSTAESKREKLNEL